MRILLLTLSAAAVTLGACASSLSNDDAPMTPLSRYSLQVEPGLDRIALAVHDGGLSANQQAALRDLARRYANDGSGPLKVEVPAGDDPVSGQQGWAIRTALAAAGVPEQNIQMASYYGPDAKAPVLAGFETVRAVVTNCSLERRTPGAHFSNQSSLGLGCAITANMAAQIANPRDIQGARAFAPLDSGRSAVVFANYRAGSMTSAAPEPLVEGQVAQAVE
ncbi:CpaD family pilus assembly protein [Brevundimonas lenta]|uniref:Pilus assembly protein CpaD n=1 Tax=Brevundimonas lenta TaxID=424796 RepID=A0A7W6NNS6_9CAUL|nr:CpaD family pilus assembly protein [Brevundimonas lenta]MBB4081769.1 pilus assembly protein CpaD [Brevundimonas lenta]